MIMLRRMPPLTLVVLALVPLTPPAQAQGTQSDRAAILEASRQFSDANMRGDVAALTELYAADAVIFPEQLDLWNSGPEPGS